MIPLYHDFTDETILIVGGGTVGARKARRFSKEARTIVISPTFPAEDYGVAERVRAAPGPDDVPLWFTQTEPALVVSATTNPAVNTAIERTARKQGILVNRADESGSRDAGSVVVPATVEDGDVTVAVSTGGKTPALAVELRRRIKSEIHGAGELTDLTSDVRDELQTRNITPEQRRDAITAVVKSEEVWKDLGAGGDNTRRTVNSVVEAALEEQS